MRSMRSMQIKQTVMALAAVILTGNAATPAGLPGETAEISVNQIENGDTLRLTYSFPQAGVTETGNGYTRIRVGNALKTSGTGKPVLPYVPLRLAIPEGKEVKSFELSVESEDTLHFPLPVEPGSAYIIPGQTNEQLEYQTDPYIYESEEFWPEESSRFGGIHFKQGNGIASYQLFPVQVSPLTHTAVAARSMTVEVIWKNRRQKRSSEKSLIKRRPLNTKEMLIQNSPSNIQSRSSETGNAAYLAITSEALKNSSNENNLQKLLLKHRERGLTTKILTVEEIQAQYTGVDLQEQIRNAIIDHYNGSGTKFVLLAGDTPIIPARQFFMDDAPHSSNKNQNRRINISTDLYYSCLDGDHNYDNDTLWGETTDGVEGGFPDILSEVYIGRFAVETEIELANIVGKTLYHLNNSRLKKVLLAGEHLGFGGVSEYAKPSMEEMWQGGNANGHFTRSFATNPILERDTLYAESYPKSTMTGAGRWLTNDLTDKLNTNEFGIVNHLGHGLEYLNMKLYLNSKEYKPASGLDTCLLNSEPIFVNSQACLSGRFEKETIAEYLTTATEFGMWGGIWNSHWGLGQRKSTDSPSQYMQRQFWHAHFGKEINEVGIMNAYADEAALEKSLNDWAFRWVSVVTHLFGDPAAPIGIQGDIPTIALDELSFNNWEIGSSFEITWYDNISENVKIELVQNNEVVYTIAESIPSNQKYEWLIPDDVPVGESFVVRISNTDLAVMDESEILSIDTESMMTLLTPTGGEVFNKGEIIDISWEDNLAEEVSIFLYNGTEIYDTLVTGLAADIQEYSWQIPYSLHHGEGYFIRVESEIKKWLHATHDTAVDLLTPVVTEYPFTLDFDNLEKGTIISDWAQVKNGNGDDFNWKVHSGATPSRAKADDWWNVTGPNTDASGEGNYIYCEASGNAGDKSAGMLSPAFNIEGLKNGEISLKVHMYNKEDYGNMGRLNIYLLVDGEWDHAVHMNGAKGDNWIEKKIDLTQKHTEAKEMYIYIIAYTGKSFASDMAIDEIRVTGEKDEVSLLKGNGTAKKPNFAVSPTVLTDDDDIVTLQIPPKERVKTVDYKLFDVVANRVLSGTAVRKSSLTWQFPVPPSLAGGSYLLSVTTEGETTKHSTVIIGKKK